MAEDAPGKALVRRLIEDVINGGDLDALDAICTPEMATGSRQWIAPFRESFPDVHMEIVQLVEEDDAVAGRFRCSATHLGRWRDREPTGRRFEDVDEVYFFRTEGGRLADGWGLEDTLSRLRQLGLDG